MAPCVVTDDYYKILEVDQSAEPHLISTSYKRLALKLHPDRNPNSNTTAAFQKLVQAYETLIDKEKRRKYDSIYHSINARTASATNVRESPSPAQKRQSEILADTMRIAKLREQQRQRDMRCSAERKAYEPSLVSAKAQLQQLEQGIKSLNFILAAEAAEEAKKNSWTMWLLSPIYQGVVETEEQKDRKERAKQERRIEKDMKERRLNTVKLQMKDTESLIERSRRDAYDANAQDQKKIENLQRSIKMKEALQREETEQRAKEKRAQELRQQQEKERIARERRAEEVMQEYARQEAKYRAAAEERRRNAARQNSCQHTGWWSRQVGYMACPNCYRSFGWLLQCPSCDKKACASCQKALRSRHSAFEDEWYWYD